MPLSLFQAFGVELEYMIVARDTLAVRPVADELIRDACREAGDSSGGFTGEFDCTGGAAGGEGVSWSNELALHVVELKTTAPAPSLDPLAGRFQASIDRMNALLAPRGSMLMPAAMHPFMDPAREVKLWPHDYSPVYQAFDRIFSCTGHGWGNLQSMHLNLPFADDDEFGRLHAAIRFLLPILPALAASSPIMDGRGTGTLDNRLAVYKTNARRVPSVSGRVVPEPVYTRADYEKGILERLYEDLAPHDPEGTLRHEWANARGAIARFTRHAIEIRVLDVQETPKADLAIAAAVVAVLRDLVAGRFGKIEELMRWEVGPLAAILDATISDGEEATIDPAYAAVFGAGDAGGRKGGAGELWKRLIATSLAPLPWGPQWAEPLRVITEEGPLARRILRRVHAEHSHGNGGGGVPKDEATRTVYRELCACLAEGRMLRASP